MYAQHTATIIMERRPTDMHHAPTGYLLCGPSASGKSTYVTRLSNANTYVVWPDEYRLFLTGDMANQSMNQAIFTAGVPLLIRAMATMGKDLVIDATNVSRRARAPLIKQLKDLGYRVEVHVFRVPIEECKRRNAGRDRRVPEDVISRQFAQWQEPALDEGVDEIISVPYIPDSVIP